MILLLTTKYQMGFHLFSFYLDPLLLNSTRFATETAIHYNPLGFTARQ